MKPARQSAHAPTLDRGAIMEAYADDFRRSSGALRGAVIRSARFADPLNFRLELTGEVGVSIHLNEAFSISRRSGSRRLEKAGTFGETFVDVPGEPVDLATSGECRVIQMIVPESALWSMLGEDHDLGRDPGLLRMLQGDADPLLLRLLCLGLVEPDAEEEVLRRVVARLAERWRGFRHHEPRRAGLAPAKLRRVTSFVDANLATASLAAMAAEADLSPYHFSREFRRETGSAPWEYVVTRRVARACALLGGRSAPLEIVAREAGFSHASHLQRHLRAKLGASAGLVRERLLL